MEKCLSLEMRPLPLYEAEMLTTDEWTKRFNGPAGITGLWQVEARGRTSKMSPEERKSLDVKYVEYANSDYAFLIDMWIILKTFKAVFRKEMYKENAQNLVNYHCISVHEPHHGARPRY